jgi:hypothetical protein
MQLSTFHSCFCSDWGGCELEFSRSTWWASYNVFLAVSAERGKHMPRNQGGLWRQSWRGWFALLVLNGDTHDCGA